MTKWQKILVFLDYVDYLVDYALKRKMYYMYKNYIYTKAALELA